MKILFTVSIVLNVLLIGIAGGMVYKHVSSPPWKEVRKDLSPETRHMMARVFQKNHSELKPVLSQARAQKKALMDILTAEEFDAAQFERGAKRLQKSQGTIRAAKISSMGELAKTLSLEERKKLSVLFEKSLRERGGKHKGGGKHKRKDADEKVVEDADVPIPAHRPE